MACVQKEYEGWPLGASVKCVICGCSWTIEQGDQDRVEVDPQEQTYTVDVSCPGCTTRYTATKAIGSYGLPKWEMSGSQYNLAAKPIEAEFRDEAEQVSARDGEDQGEALTAEQRDAREMLASAAASTTPRVTRPRTEKPKVEVESEEAHDS